MKKLLGIFLVSWPVISILASGTLEKGLGFFLTVVSVTMLMLGSLVVGAYLLQGDSHHE